MFDYHMHSRVSFDGHDTGAALVQAAERAGLKEICFTDHMDYVRGAQEQPMIFTEEDYSREYDHLHSTQVKIRRGMEYGLYPDNGPLGGQNHGLAGVVAVEGNPGMHMVVKHNLSPPKIGGTPWAAPPVH